MHDIPRDTRPEDDFNACEIRHCCQPAWKPLRVPFCQEHVLACWALVEEDRQRSNRSAEHLLKKQREAKEKQMEAERAKHPDIAEKVDAFFNDLKPGYIYYLKVGDYLKIGYTSDLAGRLRSYPPNAELLAVNRGTSDDEKKLHAKFAAYCDSGREWYLDAVEIRQHIAKVKQKRRDVDLSEIPKGRRGNKNGRQAIRPRWSNSHAI